MDGEFWVNVVFRWLHVTAAVLGVGGTIMMRFVVLPALASREDGAEVLSAIRPAFKRLIHSAIGLLLVTGFYNYLIVAMPRVKQARAEGNTALAAYHGVMGVKILLALALFGIGFALLKPVPSFHENRKTWLSVNAVLGLIILLLAAFLRKLW